MTAAEQSAAHTTTVNTSLSGNPTQPYQTPLNEQSEMTGENKYIISNGSD